MPSIKDKQTVDLIAKLFVANSMNKELTLKQVGYSDSYAETLGGQVVYGNIRVKQAIDKELTKVEAKAVATRKKRQEFWTGTMNDDNAQMPDRLRASELLGKSEADFVEKTINLNVDIPTDPVQYKSWLRKELDRLEDSDKFLEGYDRTKTAIARRY